MTDTLDPLAAAGHTLTCQVMRESACYCNPAIRDTPPTTPRETAMDVERLLTARLNVEAGYIHQPDRTRRAYWEKVAAEYDRLRGGSADHD